MMKLSSILKFVFQNILRIKSFILRNLNVSGNQMSSVDSFIRRFKYSVNGDNNLMTLNSVWGTNISIIIDGKVIKYFLVVRLVIVPLKYMVITMSLNCLI